MTQKPHKIEREKYFYNLIQLFPPLPANLQLNYQLHRSWRQCPLLLFHRYWIANDNRQRFCDFRRKNFARKTKKVEHGLALTSSPWRCFFNVVSGSIRDDYNRTWANNFLRSWQRAVSITRRLRPFFFEALLYSFKASNDTSGGRNGFCNSNNGDHNRP